MKPKISFVKQKLDELKEHDLHRSLRYGRVNGALIQFGSKNLVNFCSNDYLGLKSKKLSIGQVQSSSRLVSGNDPIFKKLEKYLARHKSQGRSLVFPTGYMANIGAIPAVVNKNDVIFSDELNHASIIEGCRLSNAKVVVYKHNNSGDLKSKIRNNHSGRKFIITEGVFSMDGDFAKLDELTDIAKKNNAIIMIDDAHGDFTVGNDGKGTPKLFGVEKEIDLYMSSLSKGLGSFGGYVAAENEVIDLLINRSKAFIYTSALPSVLAQISLDRLHQNREKRRKILERNVRLMSSNLRDIGYEIKSPSHIIPLVIGLEKKAVEFGTYLFENGIFAQPIRYPTVPLGSARVRISVTAWLSKKQIEKATEIFRKAGKKFKII